MSTDQRALQAALAVTRFGLGARPGEIQAAMGDPRGWLIAQIRPGGADQPVGAPLPAPLRRQAYAPATPSPGPGGSAPMSPGAMTPGAMTPGPMMSGAEPMMAASGQPTSGMAVMNRAAMNRAAMAPPDVPAAVQQDAVLRFEPGQTLPTMQASFQIFSTYRQTVQADKGDPGVRKMAVLPVIEEAGEEILARVRLAAATPAGFRERWTLFWANHFTMAAKGLPEAAAAGPFEREAIRPHVFGRFADLLIASTSHPGMLLYLDQVQSLGPNSVQGFKRAGKGGLNENLGREILELHTVGPDAGYTQADVTEFARALTGWSMGGPRAAPSQQGAFLYRADFHEPGPRTVMGRTYRDEGGRQALMILEDLATDPHTADHLARKIAVHFVADEPPPALVDRLRRRFMETRGDLSAVAETLIASPEAWDPTPRKFKTPYEFLVSSYRAADVLPEDPAKEIVQPLTALGMRPFSAPQPNGWSEVAADWAAPDAIVKRLTWAQGFAARNAPQAAPGDTARAALGVRLSDKTLTAVSRAESRPEAFAILLMSPEFQRR